ncbi:MAG: RNA 2',3'-cyclic phosphodiesterase [Methanobacteriota archaeon]|nr:MAG: RNA 2',3'-cyclic phosphodiesterase [Euryarchaeota archaeon]
MDKLDRCFIAIPFPPFKEAAEFLSSENLKENIKISITRPESYHITTHFFGNIPQMKQKIIIEAISRVSFPKFKVRIAVPNYFPPNKPNSARVLFLGLDEEGNEKMAELYHQITETLEGVKFKKKNKFIPHLTVARIRRGNPSKLVAKWLDFDIFKEIEIQTINFYKSDLFPQGAKHTILYSHDLA